MQKKPAAKDTSLIISFTALYAVLCFMPIFPIIGLPSKAITAAAISAPIIGLITGPYVATLSTTLGGAIAFSAGYLSPPSLISGLVASLTAGLLNKGKRGFSALIYFLLLAFFSCYPYVGPLWLYPPSIWLQTVGFIIMVSPLQSKAQNNLKSEDPKQLVLGLFTICLIATLAGQIAGSLTFEAISYPLLLTDLESLRVTWQILAFVYPIERTIIALASAIIGSFLYKLLQHQNISIKSPE